MEASGLVKDSAAEVPTSNDFEIVRRCHDEAYLFTSQGLSYEEQGNHDLACQMFHNALEKIDKALNVRCGGPECIGPMWDKAQELQRKMRKNKQMVLSQLQDIQLKNASENPLEFRSPDMPPTYREACERDFVPVLTTSHSADNLTYSDLNKQLPTAPSSNSFNHTPYSAPTKLLQASASADCFPSTNSGQLSTASTSSAYDSVMTEIFSIPQGVMVFYMSHNGTVSTSASPSALKVNKFVGDRRPNSNLPNGWLQVGDWTYPLIPGQSPALETAYGAFIFPDLGNQQDMTSVGIILPAEVDLETRRAFREVLAELTSLGHDSRASREPESFSDTLSRGIVTGAEYFSAGLVKGASVTSSAIHKGATKLKEYMPAVNEQSNVNPRVKEGLKIVRGASSDVRKASSFVVKKLGDLTIALGKKVAPHIREQGSKALTGMGLNKDPVQSEKTVNNVLKVVSGGVQGFSTVFLGLENAARILALSLSSDTVSVIGHRYGQDTAEAVGNALYSIGNVAMTANNVRNLGLRSIAKRTAKNTGKVVLLEYINQLESDTGKTQIKKQ